MDVRWVPASVRRQLKKSGLARRAITWARGEDRPFHERIDLASLPPLGHDLYIGTHHKTGTVWLQRSFSTYSRLADVSVHNLHMKQQCQRRRHGVILDYRASQRNTDFSRVRGLRMVRDPRDMLVSAMLFHRRADEPWLHRPWQGGPTYQEQITNLSEEDALLFEMDNWSGRVIREMLDFDGGDRVETIRYEDYLGDADMVRWHALLRRMGLGGMDLLLAQQALYDRSLFGLAGRGTGHISRRRAGGWQSYFSSRVAARFDDLFGDAAVRLGYGADALPAEAA